MAMQFPSSLLWVPHSGEASQPSKERIARKVHAPPYSDGGKTTCRLRDQQSQWTQPSNHLHQGAQRAREADLDAPGQPVCQLSVTE